MDGLMSGRAPAILDHLTALSDPTRSRILLLLDRRELTVSELCSVLQLPQSTVSRHLKALVDSGWLPSRAEGATRRDATAPATRLGDRRRPPPPGRGAGPVVRNGAGHPAGPRPAAVAAGPRTAGAEPG